MIHLEKEMDDDDSKQRKAQKAKLGKETEENSKKERSKQKSDMLVNNDPYIVKKKVLEGHPVPLRWVPIR